MEVARMPNAKNKSSCGKKKKNYVRLKVYLFSKKYTIVFVGAKRHLHHTFVTFSWQCISINTASMCNLGQNLGAENIKKSASNRTAGTGAYGEDNCGGQDAHTALERACVKWIFRVLYMYKH